MGSPNEYRDIAQDCLRMAVIAEDDRDRPLMGWTRRASAPPSCKSSEGGYQHQEPSHATQDR
jgi:hypothetical protein